MTKVIVGMGTCGLSAGARQVYEKLEGILAENPGSFELSGTGCIGMCYREPLVEIRSGDSRTIYGGVTEELVQEIFDSHVKGGKVLEDHVALGVEDGNIGAGSETEFQSLQEKIVLRNCGIIDPESIDEYEKAGGYNGLKKALLEMTPEGIIEEIKGSGLRGRGGAGFPTGLKWSFAAGNEADRKYVVCNADEGDPGAFMDRSILEGDPHAVLEGIIVCGRAIGASFGYIYCRAEYPLAIRRLTIAIDEAREKGYLGEPAPDDLACQGEHLRSLTLLASERRVCAGSVDDNPGNVCVRLDIVVVRRLAPQPLLGRERGSYARHAALALDRGE